MRRLTSVMAAALSVLAMFVMLAGPVSAQDGNDQGENGDDQGENDDGQGYQSVPFDGQVAGPTAEQPPTEVAGEQETNTPDLAFTGTEVNVPVAAGAILIGLGGLLSLAANKRRRQLI